MLFKLSYRYAILLNIFKKVPSFNFFHWFNQNYTRRLQPSGPKFNIFMHIISHLHSNLRICRQYESIQEVRWPVIMKIEIVITKEETFRSFYLYY